MIDHQWLGGNHIDERVDRARWPYWDLDFLGLGFSQLLGGLWLVRWGRGYERGPARGAWLGLAAAFGVATMPVCQMALLGPYPGIAERLTLRGAPP